ncbi:MAG: DNA/RNA nuclease SfsA [Clostridia bacterium]|nr:DNA/RNA nuclease SfsA [Clostridia bacterium]
MTYTRCRTGIFRSRPNRFVAVVEVDGTDRVCHVKNTGRCKELLVPGCTVVLQAADNPARKTPYDVIAVYKGERLINMDSQAPNEVAAEYLRCRFPNAVLRREVRYGDSRFDFYMVEDGQEWFIEVKGCTLEVDNVGYFPDAPTERGVKHLRHLTAAVEAGYRAAVLFVIQMEGVTAIRPNDATHPAFGDALRQAHAAGVEVWAVDCTVTPDTLTHRRPVPVEL